jgi:hypothetical protein
MKKIKNIKISEESHDLLKKYCEDNGLKIYKFLELLIQKTCRKEKDIYGE